MSLIEFHPQRAFVGGELRFYGIRKYPTKDEKEIKSWEGISIV